jgi:hypothetical protein
MYLLGTPREDICEKNSNLFFWKQACGKFIDEVPKQMQDYQVLGAKDSKFAAYNQFNFIDTLLVGCN